MSARQPEQCNKAAGMQPDLLYLLFHCTRWRRIGHKRVKGVKAVAGGRKDGLQLDDGKDTQTGGRTGSGSKPNAQEQSQKIAGAADG